MTWLRDVDRWFCAQLSPHETIFLARAKRIMGDVEAARDLVHDAYAKVRTGEINRKSPPSSESL
jgi:RNA polymerase sigma-70 factor (ECF subfamily)